MKRKEIVPKLSMEIFTLGIYLTEKSDELVGYRRKIVCSRKKI
jgi:hypothetical protein